MAGRQQQVSALPFLISFVLSRDTVTVYRAGEDLWWEVGSHQRLYFSCFSPFPSFVFLLANCDALIVCR